jgi:hypothetical protein
MAFADVVRGYWLWVVWAFIAVVVVFGYIRVRRHLDRVERAADAGDTAGRGRRREERKKEERKGVE